MKVKICGIRQLEDAQAAVDAGAWALGFIFHRASQRYIAPEAARDIVSVVRERVLTVGVFVDYPLAELNAVVQFVGLQAAQLHGQEDLDYARSVKAPTVIKAFRVGEGFALEELEAFRGLPVLLDAYDARAAGGTGQTFDWSLAQRAVDLGARVILAGGLHPGNVAAAIKTTRPWAIDVSSGVEIAPGCKDLQKIRGLFEAIQASET